MKNRCLTFALGAAGACLIASAASGQTFGPSGSISIPATGTSGIANPYPSTISVAGLGSGGNLADVNVNIPNIVHTFANDIDFVLVGPTGVACVFLSDVGSSVAFDPPGPHTYTIDDSAAALFPTGAAANGSYKPTNTAPNPDNFPAPGPGNLDQPTPLLSMFNNTNGNGIWSLYIIDDVGGDVGTMPGGWSITLQAGGNNCVLPLAHPWCAADTNNDNAVTVTDLLSVINTWGPPGPPRPLGDIAPLPNGDCVANVTDLLAVINSWGACPLPTGACCGVGGVCTTVSQTACQNGGGVYQGNGVTCASVVCPNVPANDNCAGAFTLVTGSNQAPGLNNGTNLNATNGTVQSSTTCPLGGSVNFTRDVWYKHQVPTAPGLQGQILALRLCSTLAPFTDTALAVYQQNTPLNCFDAGGMSMIACNDDACGLLSELQTATVAPGTTLYIRVGSWATGATNQGPFILSVGVTDITSDNCIGAATLAVGGSITETLGDAHADLGPACVRQGCAGPPVPPGVGRWYKITGNGQTLTASTCSSASDIFDGRLTVYCGPDCGTLQCGPSADCDIGTPQLPACPAFQGESVSFCSAFGTTYWLLVHAADIPSGVSGNFTVTLTTSGFPCAGGPNCGPPPPPANDLCTSPANAVQGNNIFDNTGATDSGPGACAAITRDVWFNFTVPNAPTTCASLYISTQGSLVIQDTVLAVYQGPACPTAANSHIACNDDAFGFLSILQIPINNSGNPGTVAPGAQIKIRVGSWGTDVTNQGVGNLNITCLPP